MALKEYSVDINGIEHTMRLSESDAKRYGEAAKPANKVEAKTEDKTAADDGASDPGASEA